MKTLLLIIAVLFLLTGAGAGFLTYDIDGDDIAKLEKVEAEKKQYMEQFTDKDPEAKAKAEQLLAEGLKDTPSLGRLKAGSSFALVLMVLALAAIAITFAKPQLLKPAAAIIVLVGVFDFVIHPVIKKGNYGGQSGKTIAIFAAGFAIVGVLAALFAKAKSDTAKA